MWVPSLVLLIMVPVSLCDFGGWTMEDLSLFDVVEDVGQNFYQLFDIPQDAKLADVKKAYRRLSLTWHPDRNSDENATVKFRQIAAVYEILKSEQLRSRYDQVLEFGLPDWRQPIYYYRHVRKMPWWETLLLLVVIVTVGHYLMMWGAYFERYLAVSEAISGRIKKQERRAKNTFRKNKVDVDELIEAETSKHLAPSKPSLAKTLPVSFVVGVWSAAVHTPSAVREMYVEYQRRRLPVVDEDEDESQVERVFEHRPVYEFEMAQDLKPVSTFDQAAIDRYFGDNDGRANHDDCKLGLPVGIREWTFEELSHLVKLSTVKYPAGTVNRWEKIADILGRRPDAVTAMIGKLKHMDSKEYQKLCDGPAPNENLVLRAKIGGAKDNVCASISDEPTVVPNGVADKSRSNDDDDNDDFITNPAAAKPAGGGDDLDLWGQTQQKLLEQALQQFPKGTVERWEKVARCVPGKSKEECMQRYKQLVELVRQRKVKKK